MGFLRTVGRGFSRCLLKSSGDPVGQFYMDPVSGVITTTAVSLDREIRNEYTLTVSATDDFRMVPSKIVWNNVR